MKADYLLFQMLKGGVGKRARDEIGASIAKTLRRGAAPKHMASPVLDGLLEIGFCALDPVFNAEQIASIHEYLADKPKIFYNVGPDVDGSKIHLGHRFAEYPQEVISACPEFAAVATHPALLDIAEAYLEAPPLVTILTAWWSYPSDEPLGGMQHFHHDRDDFRCLKLFVYLTDVADKTGPHVFVDGSHDSEQLCAGWVDDDFWAWMDASHRKDEASVREWFDDCDIRTIEGPAGSTFLEDTRGLHRGVPPVDAPRLAFEICYTMLPKYGTAYKRPIPWREAPDQCRLFYEQQSVVII